MLTTRPLRHYLTLLFLALVWGSSYFLIKKGLSSFTPMQVGALRITITALCFLPLLMLQWKRIKPRDWRLLALVGVFGNGIPAYLFPMAQQHVESSVAGILNSLTPLFVLVVGVLLFRVRPVSGQVIGVLLGLLGAVVLVLFGVEGQNWAGDAWFAALIVLATMFYGLSANVIKRLAHLPPEAVSSGALAMIGIPSAIILLFNSPVEVLQTDPMAWGNLGYIALLAVLSTVICNIIFVRLIQATDPVFAAMVGYLMPIVSIGWGVWDGEPLNIFHFLGMGCILGGVYLVSLRKKRAENAAALAAQKAAAVQ